MNRKKWFETRLEVADVLFGYDLPAEPDRRVRAVAANQRLTRCADQ